MAQVEGDDIGNAFLFGDHFHVGGDSVYRNASISIAEDTIHFASDERDTTDTCGLAEVKVLGLKVSDLDVILDLVALHTAGSVRDGEGLAVSNIGGALGLVIGVMGPAWNGPALLRVNPEVG